MIWDQTLGFSFLVFVCALVNIASSLAFGSTTTGVFFCSFLSSQLGTLVSPLGDSSSPFFLHSCWGCSSSWSGASWSILSSSSESFDLYSLLFVWLSRGYVFFSDVFLLGCLPFFLFKLNMMLKIEALPQCIFFSLRRHFFFLDGTLILAYQ